MFAEIFDSPVTVARHHEGPMLKERLAFLSHLDRQGHFGTGLEKRARNLLSITQTLRLASWPRQAITLTEVKRRIGNRLCLLPLAVQWLQFIGRLKKPCDPLTPWAKKIKAFADYMEQEAELSPATICSRCSRVRLFFEQLRIEHCSLHAITPDRIDTAFQKMLAPGGYSRTTIQTAADTLRAFFRFAEARGWCRKGLAGSIRAPRVYTQALLPLGPSWDDVRRLLVMTEGDRRGDIRDRPIPMLFAIYGLRRGEVSRLRLEDFDWAHEEFRVVSSKSGKARTYPLTRTVGSAILRYLQEVRPRSSHRELFLTLDPPFRPVYKALGEMVRQRLRTLNVSLPHYGPHALRHACAARLLATGLSLKEIGDQLGHSHPDSTRIYAKVDLVGLREVADFDLGGVL
jgi:integrase/recombinase XerD